MWNLIRWEWLGILLARVVVGLLFLLSGSGKLWNADKRAAMRKTLEDAHIPRPGANALLVASVEFSGGAMLLLGAFTPIACVLLSGVMAVAIVTTRMHEIKATTAFDWLAEFLYLPELLYLVILVWLFFSGPGHLSLDHLVLVRAFS